MAATLLINYEVTAEIRAAVERARRAPIPWAVLRLALPLNQDRQHFALADRQPTETQLRPASQEVLIPYGYRLCVSFEEQPSGLLAHLSMSIDRAGRVPHPVAAQMILDAAGFDFDPADPPEGVGFWTEEFMINGEPGGVALNFLIPADRQRRDEHDEHQDESKGVVEY